MEKNNKKYMKTEWKQKNEEMDLQNKKWSNENKKKGSKKEKYNK